MNHSHLEMSCFLIHPMVGLCLGSRYSNIILKAETGTAEIRNLIYKPSDEIGFTWYLLLTSYSVSWLLLLSISTGKCNAP